MDESTMSAGNSLVSDPHQLMMSRMDKVVMLMMSRRRMTFASSIILGWSDVTVDLSFEAGTRRWRRPAS